MSFPKINKNAVRTLAVPELSGGINLRDSASSVGDNQLTDGLNIWFSDGVLKSRPGIVTDTEHVNLLECANSDTLPGSVRIFREIKTDIDKSSYTLSADQLVSRYSTEEQGGGTQEYVENVIRFFWVGKRKNIVLPSITVTKEGGEYKALGYFVIFHGGKIYCFTEAKDIYVLATLDGTGQWEKLPESETYVPTVLTNCVPNPYFEMGFNRGVNDLLNWGAKRNEDLNILSDRYKIQYSTYNPNTTITENVIDEEGNVTGKRPLSKMKYLLYERVDTGKFAGQTVKAVYTDKQGKEYTHEVYIDGSSIFYAETEAQADGLKMQVVTCMVRFMTDEGNVKNLYEEDYIPNNMIITAPCSVREEKGANVFNMHRSVYLGGGELFLCGNTDQAGKNLVVWSKADNPLYFPENNYFYVGDGGSPVTGFGKQGDRLVIFKRNETYSTTRESSSDIGTYFPLTLINANIGCDLPDTVQLCRNRLVWATSDGKVYTLVSGSYTECSIYEVGGMVERYLRNGLEDAAACDYEGHYLLLANSTAYLMDYNSRGFQYVSSYQKSEDASLKIPWYCWKFGFTDSSSDYISSARPCVLGETLLIAAHFETENTRGAHFVAFQLNIGGGNTDTAVIDNAGSAATVTMPFVSSFTTKLFEFGAQGYYKNVERAVLSLGNNGGEPINVSFVTDMGTEEAEVIPDGEDTQPYSAGYVKSVQVNPCIRQVERFGVRLSCNGPLAVDGITLSYRVTGGVR